MIDSSGVNSETMVEKNDKKIFTQCASFISGVIVAQLLNKLLLGLFTVKLTHIFAGWMGGVASMGMLACK